MPPKRFQMHHIGDFDCAWGAENPNQFSDFSHFVQLSGQVITLPFGVFMPPDPSAVWSHWVSITTNPLHSFKINGRGPSLTPEMHWGEALFSFLFPRTPQGSGFSHQSISRFCLDTATLGWSLKNGFIVSLNCNPCILLFFSGIYS